MLILVQFTLSGEWGEEIYGALLLIFLAHRPIYVINQQLNLHNENDKRNYKFMRFAVIVMSTHVLMESENRVFDYLGIFVRRQAMKCVKLASVSV